MLSYNHVKLVAPGITKQVPFHIKY